MIRPPAPAVIRECDLEDFKKRAALKEWKDVTVVALFDNEYMVGDMVEWWKDDAWWTGRITELSTIDKGAEVVTVRLVILCMMRGYICWCHAIMLLNINMLLTLVVFFANIKFVQKSSKEVEIWPILSVLIVQLALLSFPHGEGLTCRGIRTSKLRPAFSWSRQNQWSLLPPKVKL